MSPFDAERIALWWGPGVLILIVFGFGFLRLAKYWIERSMDVKRQQAISVFGMFQTYVEQFLSAQRCQADALERRDSTESFEHQEMLIALKAVHRDVESLLTRHHEAIR